MEAPTLWLLAGAALVVLEAVTAPGVGIFLAGFGAVSTGIVTQIGLVAMENTGGQFAWFFGLTTLWAVLLWKPLQKFRLSQGSKGRHTGVGVQDIVGGVAIVGKGGLRRGEAGQAKWSGTLMNAVIDDKCHEVFIAEGTRVIIHSVSGTTISVSPAP